MSVFRPAALLIATLTLAVPSWARAHDLQTTVSDAGLGELGSAIASQLPTHVTVPTTQIDLFTCNGGGASIVVENTEVALAIEDLTLTQPRGGQLQVDVRFSASAAGQLDFNRVLACGGQFTCQQNFALQGARATLLLEADEASSDGLRLRVVDVDLDIDPDQFDFTLSGCQFADLVNAAVNLFETVGISLVRKAVENVAQSAIAPTIDRAVVGLSSRSTALLAWNLSTSIESLELTSGVQVVADADITSTGRVSSCLVDPGEPLERAGTPPVLSRAFHVETAVNLGLLDDVLYHVWSASARCPASTGDATHIGEYLVGFPGETKWLLEATVLVPPRIEGKVGSGVALEMVFDEVHVRLQATLPSGVSKSAEINLAARADILLGVDSLAAALRLDLANPRVTKLVMEDELDLAAQGFDAGRISGFLTDYYLPTQLASMVDVDTNIPLGIGIGTTHAVVREAKSNSAYAVLGVDLFNEPANDVEPPSTKILNAPSSLVSAKDAVVYVTGDDSQIPSELLRYRVRINGAELDLSTTSRIQVGRANFSGQYSLEVFAVDLAGNVDATPATVTLDVDGVRPALEIEHEIIDDVVSLSFQAADDRTETSKLRASVVVTNARTGVEVRRLELAEGVSSAQIDGFEPGQTFRLSVVVLDEAGNEGASSIVFRTNSSGGCAAAPGRSAVGGAVLVLLALILVTTAKRRWHVTLLVLALGVGAGCDSGPEQGAATSDLPALPDCASEITRAMWSAMQLVADRSTIEMNAALGRASSVDPDLYIDGPEIFTKWAQLIEEAELEVNMQFYKWEPETDATETILSGIKALEERRRREGATEPVLVRIVIDTSALGVAAPVTEEHMPWVMERIAAYDIDPQFVTLTFAVRERGFLDQFGNLHVKTVVVDGRVAMITGANPEYQHNFDQPWHDLGTVFHGDIVQAILDDFDYTFADSEEWVCRAGQNQKEQCLVAVEPFVHRSAPVAFSSANTCAVLALTRAPSSTVNNSVDNPQDQAFLAAFGAAQHVIKIETPNINDDAAKAAIIAAVERGVVVKMVTSKEFNETSEGFVGGPNGQNIAELYSELAIRGVKDVCSKLQVRWYSHDGLEPVVGNGAYASHTKYTSVDEQIVIVGTTNMDTASWNFSHELNLSIDDADMASTLNAQLFDADWDRAVVVEQCLAR